MYILLKICSSKNLEIKMILSCFKAKIARNF